MTETEKCRFSGPRRTDPLGNGKVVDHSFDACSPLIENDRDSSTETMTWRSVDIVKNSGKSSAMYASWERAEYFKSS